MPRPAFAQPILPPGPVTHGPNIDRRDTPSVGMLLDESTRLRLQIAQRPTQRADLEEALLDICLTQARHVQSLQKQREKTAYLTRRDPDAYAEALLERESKAINAEAGTLVRLVRSYRLFIPNESADPANYANLFNPFLDWLERSALPPDAPPDLRERTHAAITDFIASLPRRVDYPGAPPSPEPEAFIPLA